MISLASRHGAAPAGDDTRRARFSKKSAAVVALVFLWAILLASSTTLAAPAWRWANPTPHGANIYGLASRGSLVVEVGEFGQVYTSDDLDTWSPQSTGVQNTLRSAVFFGSRLIITGSEGLILYADDITLFTPVSLGTSDWIEGVACSTNRLVAVGDHGAIYTSVDGANWQRLANASEWLRSVAYGGGKFVAVGDAGFVTTSPDGLTWTAAARPTSKDLNKVEWLNDRFWILGNSGLAMTSPSGTSWTDIPVGTTNDLFGAATDGSQWTVVGRSELRTSSPPFLLWTSQTGNSPSPPSWTYYKAIWDGSEFLVAGRSGMLVEGYRASGSATVGWYVNTDSPRNWLWSLSHAGGIYTACGEKGGIFTSVDGYRFDQEAVPAAAQSQIMEGVAGTTNILVAVGTAGTILWSPGGYKNVVSTNAAGQLETNQVTALGLSWNGIASSPTSNELEGIAVFNGGFIASGGQGTILTSPDGENWTLRNSGVSSMLSSVSASPTRAVISGDLGAILTSENGTSWTKRASGVTNWITQVAYLNGQFLGVGEAGLILTSPDGIVWTRRSSGVTAWMNASVYQDGNYYAVGGQGTVLKSADTLSWSLLEGATTKSFYGAAGDNGRLVLAGLEGSILRTRLIPWTTPVNFLNSGVETNAHVFLFEGELDQRFLLQRSSNFLDWSNIASLEILDNAGVLLNYQTIGRGNLWFYRTRVIGP